MIPATPAELLAEARARLQAAGRDPDTADHIAADCREHHPYDDRAYAQALGNQVSALLADERPLDVRL